MHYQYKLIHPSKKSQAIGFLKTSGMIGIYEIEDNKNLILGGFSPKMPKEPVFLKLIVCENEEINWAEQWEDDIIEVKIANKKFRLKSGPGFGDSSHPTTRLCLQALEKFQPDSIIDIGSGSGILSIAAMTLGIKNVVSIEIENEAIGHHIENLRLNNFEPNLIKNQLSIQDFEHSNQLILMNMILSEQKQVLSGIPKILDFKKNWFISGILQEDIEEAKKFYQTLGFKILELTTLEKWSGLLMNKG
jgi:ribosomal protein L11 methyltransferase